MKQQTNSVRFAVERSHVPTKGFDEIFEQAEKLRYAAAVFNVVSFVQLY